MLVGQHQCDVVATHHGVLRRTHNWATVGRSKNIVCRKHQSVRFDLGFDRKRQVNRHLVAVEVSVETFTHKRMQVDRITFNQDRLKRLNTHSVKCWSTIQHDRVIANDLLENIPNLFVFTLKHFLGAFDRIGVAQLFEFANDERLVKFQRNLFGQTALVELQAGTHHDDGTG